MTYFKNMAFWFGTETDLNDSDPLVDFSISLAGTEPLSMFFSRLLQRKSKFVEPSPF